MIRIRFNDEQDRIRGNYLLATKSIVRRLRGQLFEVAEHDLKLLEENQLHYTAVSIPNQTCADNEVRNPLTIEL
jgi:hypothetical protein